MFQRAEIFNSLKTYGTISSELHNGFTTGSTVQLHLSSRLHNNVTAEQLGDVLVWTVKPEQVVKVIDDLPLLLFCIYMICIYGVIFVYVVTLVMHRVDRSSINLKQISKINR